LLNLLDHSIVRCIVVIIGTKYPLKPFRYTVDQKTFRIYNVEVGGLGNNPTLLIGSLFYHGDKKVLDHDKGVFDKNAVKMEIEEVDRLCGEYGMPYAIDVVATTAKAMENYLTFLSDTTNCILFIDGVSNEARIRGYILAGELGIQEKAVANGIYLGASSEELEAIRESRIQAVVLLAYDPHDTRKVLLPERKLEIVKNELLPTAERLGVSKVLVDTIVLDYGDMVTAATSMKVIKDALGLPVGLGPANILGCVTGKNFGKEGATSIHTGIAIYLRMMGADFIMYGPLKRAKYVVPGLATIDGILGYAAKLEGDKVPLEHPLNKTIRRLQRLFLQFQR